MMIILVIFIVSLFFAWKIIIKVTSDDLITHSVHCVSIYFNYRKNIFVEKIVYHNTDNTYRVEFIEHNHNFLTEVCYDYNVSDLVFIDEL